MRSRIIRNHGYWLLLWLTSSTPDNLILSAVVPGRRRRHGDIVRYSHIESARGVRFNYAFRLHSQRKHSHCPEYRHVQHHGIPVRQPMAGGLGRL